MFANMSASRSRFRLRGEECTYRAGTSVTGLSQNDDCARSSIPQCWIKKGGGYLPGCAGRDVDQAARA
jgi:hypothetical protein